MSAPRGKPRAPRRRRAVKVTLAGHAGIAEADALRGQLAAALDSGAPVSVDASKVRRVDTATLQVLLAFRRAADGTGREVRWVRPSAEFVRAASLLALASELGCAPDVPAA